MDYTTGKKLEEIENKLDYLIMLLTEDDEEETEEEEETEDDGTKPRISKSGKEYQQ